MVKEKVIESNVDQMYLLGEVQFLNNLIRMITVER